MESWQILKSVPRGLARKVASIYSVSSDLARKWMREPESETNLTGTGARNPIDRFDALFDFFLEHCPAAAEMIVSRYERKLDTHPAARRADSRETLRRMIRESSEAVSAAATGAPPAEVEREISEAMAAMRQMARVANARRQVNG